MTKKYHNLKEKHLDGELLFRRYWEMGDSRSIESLTEWANLQGMKSSTGANTTCMGVWKSMWRWASLKENRETAWNIFRDANPDANYSYWIQKMIRTWIPSAWQHPTLSKKNRFLKENGWL